MRFDSRTTRRDRHAGKGREEVNLCPGLLAIGVVFGLYTLGGLKASADYTCANVQAINHRTRAF